MIVPVYNVERYLDECLSSIRTQSFRYLEIVVVDDGSTDDSRAVAARHARADRRIKVIRQANGGLGAARNTGIEHSTGAFLVFVDSDDRLPRDAIRHLSQALEKHEADIAVGYPQRFNATRSWIPQWVGEAHAELVAVDRVDEHLPLLRNNYTWGKIYSRTFWDAGGYRFREGVAYEDQPVVTEMMLRARRVVSLDVCVYDYRARDDNSSISQQTHTLKDLRDRIAAWTLTAEKLEELSVDDVVVRAWLLTVYATHVHWYLNSPSVADPEYWSLLRETLLELDSRGGLAVEGDVPPARRLALELLRRDEQDELLNARSAGLYEAKADSYDLRGSTAVWRTRYPEGHPFHLPAEARSWPVDRLLVRHQVRQLRHLADTDELEVAGFAYLQGVDYRQNGQVVHLVVTGPDGSETRIVACESDDPDLVPSSGSWDAAAPAVGFRAAVPLSDVAGLVTGPKGAVSLDLELQTDGGSLRRVRVTEVNRWGSPDQLGPMLSAGGAKIAIAPRATAADPLVLSVSRPAQRASNVLRVERRLEFDVTSTQGRTPVAVVARREHGNETVDAVLAPNDDGTLHVVLEFPTPEGAQVVRQAPGSSGP
ncbi:glycosyltransferase family 2 protein [Luteimicrobium album]|uniref:glycosyltransferase family 2 protein n=1 Tax=Luteimicrobium album TaxID=1054550 RepID=UPI0024E0CFAF|nr:glycosyltransferase family A protein [Luteimicrobium album]